MRLGAGFIFVCLLDFISAFFNIITSNIQTRYVYNINKSQNTFNHIITKINQIIIPINHTVDKSFQKFKDAGERHLKLELERDGGLNRYGRPNSIIYNQKEITAM